MSYQVTFEQLVEISPKVRSWLGFRSLLRPLAREDRLAYLLRGVCCAWCRECEQYFSDAESLSALQIIEEFSRGNAGGDSLSCARKLARKAARRVARKMKGKTKEYWAAHAVCEAARNDAYESLLWTSDAVKEAGVYIDRKLVIFREFVQGVTRS